MKKLILLAAAFLSVSLGASGAIANDSEAETSLGGLVLKQSEHISMDSEDLYISAKQVRVKYRFTNTSDKDVTTLISFPLPSLPEDDEEVYYFIGAPDFDTLNFKTMVDGKPAPLTMVNRAMIGDRDVTARVKALGWPVNWLGNHDYEWPFDKMTAKQRQPFIAEGLIRRVVYDGPSWFPAWKIARHVTREQTFPAGKTVSVEHSYEPLIGGSAGGPLNKSIRESEPEYLKSYQDRYCVDDHFVRGFDRRSAATGRNDQQFYTETWIGYILSSGANWKGPIKDFRLVIDKGSTKNLVSFCMDGVKKIAPTQFEIRKKNFTPTKDLNILIVQWHNIDA